MTMVSEVSPTFFPAKVMQRSGPGMVGAKVANFRSVLVVDGPVGQWRRVRVGAAYLKEV